MLCSDVWLPAHIEEGAPSSWLAALECQVRPAGLSCPSPFTGNLSRFHVWMVAGILGTE